VQVGEPGVVFLEPYPAQFGETVAVLKDIDGEWSDFWAMGVSVVSESICKGRRHRAVDFRRYRGGRHTTLQPAELLFDASESLLQLGDITSAETRSLSIGFVDIFASEAVPNAVSAAGLCAVAFDFALAAEETAVARDLSVVPNHRSKRGQGENGELGTTR
jgi:hypothetical protein